MRKGFLTNQKLRIPLSPPLPPPCQTPVFGPANVCFPQDEVIINDCTLSIGENLYAALKSIRRQQGRLTMWVDALCLYFDRY
jgi:hypothetical protein